MNIQKLAPWNWFKDEEQLDGKRHAPVHHAATHSPSPLTQLHQDIDRVFDSVFRQFGFSSFDFDNVLPAPTKNLMLRPNVDIVANNNTYSITVEVPGVSENDIQLELVDNQLVIKGEKKKVEQEDNEDFYRVERAYGSFQRILSLPVDADQNDINAEFSKGVLIITLPRKSPEKLEGKVIHIKKSVV